MKNKKKTKNKKRLTKEQLKRRKKAKILTTRWLILVICMSFFVWYLITNDKHEIKNLITTTNIQTYIKATTNNSKSEKQLDWRMVAAIHIAKNNNNPSTETSEDADNIAKTFYDESENLKSFAKIIEDNNLNAKQTKLAYKNLEALNKENYSLRKLNRGLSEEKEQFIDSIKDKSIEDYKQYGILPSITISQAILESDWGRSKLASEHNNLFGIKADKSWTGAVITYTTKENYDDVIKANFRAYNSKEESVEDHGKFLVENSLYRENGLFDVKTFVAQANALQNAGYATAKDENGNLIYASMLINVIEENNLMLIDIEAEENN